MTQLIIDGENYIMAPESPDAKQLTSLIAKCLRDKIEAGSTVENAIAVIEAEVDAAVQEAINDETEYEEPE